MQLALFDFDGTLTHGDSVVDFVRFSQSALRVAGGVTRLAPWILGYAAGVVSNQSAKESVLRYFFGGLPQKEFSALCMRYAQERLPSTLRSDALAQLDAHLASGDQVAIVSAAPRLWIEPWSQAHGVPVLLATELEIEDGRITGRVQGRNCHGSAKAERVREQFDLAAFAEITAYGDSPGDRPMLELANKAWYRGKRIR